MKLLDKRTSGDLIRLITFLVVTAMATSVLVLIIGNISFEPTRTYKADFTDATGVVKGDDVRIAGVRVGSVKKISIVESNRDSGEQSTFAEIEFKLDSDVHISDATQVEIKYRNLVGQRYLSLFEGIGGSEPLDEGSTIPVSRTKPALDLTLLFNGFKPLFDALSPSDVNQLSYEIIQVFQGEGGTLESLLSHTASVTNTLAQRDEVIGSLVDNLNEVVSAVGARDDQLSSLIVNFRDLVGGLNDDREQILQSLDGISQLSVQTAGLITGLRPDFVKSIQQLNILTRNIVRNGAELDRTLQVLPIKLNKVGRTAIYGSWFNFYLCDFKARVNAPGIPTVPVDYSTNADRCDLG